MRLDGYIRVSSVAGRSGDTFISPDVQREKIQGWARLHGHQVGEILVELDESGGSMDRPLMQKALERVDGGQSAGIIVAKLDRFGRTLAGALEAIRRLEAAGGQLVSVDDQFDTSTPMGRFALQIMLALAELEHARIRENWRVAQQRAVDRGVHITPRVPVGYQREHKGAGLTKDPVVAPAVEEAFRMRADGVAMQTIAEMLNDRGVRTSYDGGWIGQTVAVMLQNRVYLGEARGQGGVIAAAGAHEALTDPATFTAAGVRRDPGVRNATTLLAGILRCAGCRYVMTRTSNPGNRAATRYRCRGKHTVGQCAHPTAVHPHVIEEYVIEQFLAALDDDSPVLEAAARTITVEPLRNAADAAERELVAWRDDQAIVDLGRNLYLEGLQTRAQRRDAAHDALQDALGDLQSADAFEHAVSLRNEFPLLPVEEQRALLASTIDVVFLRRGRSIPISDRALILWRGQGPNDLPRRAKPQPLRSFAFPSDRDVTIGMPPTADVAVRRSKRTPRLSR